MKSSSKGLLVTALAVSSVVAVPLDATVPGVSAQVVPAAGAMSFAECQKATTYDQRWVSSPPFSTKLREVVRSSGETVDVILESGSNQSALPFKQVALAVRVDDEPVVVDVTIEMVALPYEPPPFGVGLPGDYSINIGDPDLNFPGGTRSMAGSGGAQELVFLGDIDTPTTTTHSVTFNETGYLLIGLKSGGVLAGESRGRPMEAHLDFDLNGAVPASCGPTTPDGYVSGDFRYQLGEGSEAEPLGTGFISRALTDPVAYWFPSCAVGIHAGGEDFVECYANEIVEFLPSGMERVAASYAFPDGDAQSGSAQMIFAQPEELACGPAWMKIQGSPYVNNLQPYCPIAITAPSLIFGGHDPSAITVIHNREQGGGYQGSFNQAPAKRLGSQVMFLDSGAGVGSFASPELRIDDSVRGVGVGASELTRIPVSGDVASVNMTALNLAYGISDSGDDRSLRYWPAEGFTGYSDVIKVRPELGSSVLRPSDPDLVEADDLFFWIDQPGGVTGRWEPDEPFDLIRRPVWQPLRLISLGDSYAAGEGSTQAELHACSRSPYGYAGSALQPALAGRSTASPLPLSLTITESMRLRSLVFGADNPEQLYRTGSGSEWTYAACTSAQSFNLWADDAVIPSDPRKNLDGNSPAALQEPGLPPDNFTQLMNPAVDLVWEPNAVTITMGGNDSGFVPLFTECLKRSVKLVAAGFQVDMNDSTLLPQSVCELVFWSGMPSINPHIDDTKQGLGPTAFLDEVVGPRLQHTFDQIKQEIPRSSSDFDQDAVVTVFGYPKLMQTGCYLGNLLGPHSLGWIEGFQIELNATIAEEAHAQGFQYVEPVEFEGHRICSEDPYLNDVVLEFTGSIELHWLGIWRDPYLEIVGSGVSDDLAGVIGNTKSLHPNDKGWQAYTAGWERVSSSSPIRAANGVGVYRESGGGAAALTAADSFLALDKSLVAMMALPQDVPPTTTPSNAIAAISVETAVPVTGCEATPVVSNASVVTATFSGAEPGANIWLRAGSAAPTLSLLGETFVVADASGAGSAQLTMPAEGSWQIVISLQEGDAVLGGEIASTVLEVSDGDRPCVLDDLVESATPGPITSIDVLANDAAGDAAWDTASLTVTTPPKFGTATVTNGAVDYIPVDGFRHLDSFAYSVCSDTGVCGQGTVTVDYRSGCDIVGESAATIEGTPADEVICGSPASEIINGGGGADDIYPGGGGDIIDVIQNVGGTVFRATPEDLVIGDNVVTVGVGYALPAAAGGPTAIDDQFTLAGLAGSINPVLNDLSGDSAIQLESFRVIARPGEIIVTNTEIVGADLTVWIETEIELTGAPVTYEICDVDNRCSTATIRITASEEVTSSPPVAADDAETVSPGEAIDVDVLANDVDVDGDLDESSLTIATNPVEGSASVIVDAADGALIRYESTETFDGEAVLTYEICDTEGQCDTATLTITAETSGCTIIGTDGDDTIDGTSGDDVICGLGGNDTINGFGGDDIIRGGVGADIIKGGSGNDTIFGGRGADSIEGGGGDDILRGSRGADTIKGNAGSDELHGGRGQDHLSGNAGNDMIYLGAGADQAFGGLDNDLIVSRRGADTSDGGAGHDTIRGGMGADLLLGGSGDDLLYGNRGADELRGGGGNDVIRGGRGHDSLYGGAGNDTLFGGRGDDVIRGGGGSDDANGGPGTDSCTGTESSVSCQF